MNPLSPEIIRRAYREGWFPMSDESGDLGWYQPHRRALFPISGIHVSRSLAKTIRQGRFKIDFDGDFEAVIRGCVRPEDNWINEAIIEAYVDVFRQGWAHCVECRLDGELVGGLYGLALGGCFSAESMFHRVRDASKVALWAMVEKCRELGFVLFDAQVMNPHLASLGAYEIPAQDYLEQLRQAWDKVTPWSGPIQPFR